jgi:uncharacterized protein
MRLVLVLLVVLAGIWLFRSNRRNGGSDKKKDDAAGNPSQAASAPALEMVRCKHCDLHLPLADAVTGRQGVYCSREHQMRVES